MPTNSYSNFATQYQQMLDGQLLLLANEGGLVDEAHQALTEELRKRNLKKQDIVQQEKKSPHEHRLGAAEEKQFRWADHWWVDPGTGYYFFGRHYLNEADKSADIQLRTKWIALGGIPLIPLASYRLKCKQKSFGWFRWNEEQRVVNRVALNWNQILLTWIKTFLSMAVVIAAFALYDWLKGRR
jgi:hypothetical protein